MTCERVVLRFWILDSPVLSKSLFLLLKIFYRLIPHLFSLCKQQIPFPLSILMNIISGLPSILTLKIPNVNMYLLSPGIFTHKSKEMGLWGPVPSPFTLFFFHFQRTQYIIHQPKKHIPTFTTWECERSWRSYFLMSHYTLLSLARWSVFTGLQLFSWLNRMKNRTSTTSGWKAFLYKGPVFGPLALTSGGE